MRIIRFAFVYKQKENRDLASSVFSRIFFKLSIQVTHLELANLRTPPFFLFLNEDRAAAYFSQLSNILNFQLLDRNNILPYAN